MDVDEGFEHDVPFATASMEEQPSGDEIETKNKAARRKKRGGAFQTFSLLSGCCRIGLKMVLMHSSRPRE